MPWFDRHCGDASPVDAHARLNDAVNRSGLLAALERACGRPGLRRFILRFEAKGNRVRLRGVEAVPLAEGGGPPPSLDSADLEAALARLRTFTPADWRFSAGALGVVRDGDGRMDVSFRYDEDTVGFTVESLRWPGGPANPVERPVVQKLLDQWAARMGSLAWTVAEDAWQLEAGNLRYRGTSQPADILATWRDGLLSWYVENSEDLAFRDAITVDFASATEIVRLAAAQMGASGGFEGEAEDGRVVFLAVRPGA